MTSKNRRTFRADGGDALGEVRGPEANRLAFGFERQRFL